MLDPERILGALIRQGMGSTRKSKRSRKGGGMSSMLGPGVKGAVGLGIVGVAIAAFDHFMEKKNQTGAPTGSGHSAPPSAPPASGSRPAAPPPPPPPAGSAASSDASGAEQSRQNAVLLIRSMIAAANADGLIDKSERKTILGRMFEAGLGEEDRDFIERELADPPRIETLIPAIRAAGLQEQAYAVTMLAIEIDTPSEHDYINYLRLQLGIDDSVAERVHRQLGLNCN